MTFSSLLYMRFMRNITVIMECQLKDLHTFACPSFQLLLRSPDMRISALCFSSWSVFYTTNWMIDLPRFLFLDLNDISGNFSNCHDLICTFSVSCWYVDGGCRGTTAFQKGDTLRSTFIQARWNSSCSLVSFFLYLLLSPLVTDPLN